MLSSMEKEQSSEDAAASFGFRDVPAQEKKGLVRGVFDSVADRYDLMNDLMSGGVHRIWKDALIDWLAPRPGQRLLDVAGGTGDVALRFVKRSQGGRSAPAKGGEAVICDINAAMMRAGRGRPALAAQPIQFVCGDAERLPLPSAAFDAYTIAFGIRNVTDIDAALREARRVLKPGGRFMCLEFSHPTTEALSALYDAFSFHVIPRIGATVAGDQSAYQYLVESIRRFPDQTAFSQRIEAAGLARVSHRNLSGGIAAIHAAWRI